MRRVFSFAEGELNYWRDDLRVVLTPPKSKFLSVVAQPVGHLVAALCALLGAVLATWEPGFPLWDEIAAAVWLEPDLVVEAERLYVDYNTQFGPSYGDTLSWREHYQPGLGEQAANVIRKVDRTKLEALLLRNVGRLDSAEGHRCE